MNFVNIFLLNHNDFWIDEYLNKMHLLKTIFGILPVRKYARKYMHVRHEYISDVGLHFIRLLRADFAAWILQLFYRKHMVILTNSNRTIKHIIILIFLRILHLREYNAQFVFNFFRTKICNASYIQNSSDTYIEPCKLSLSQNKKHILLDTRLWEYISKFWNKWNNCTFTSPIFRLTKTMVNYKLLRFLQNDSKNKYIFIFT